MRILITGGTGFIGSHFAAALRREGSLAVLLDLWPPSDDVAGEGITFLRGDVRDPSVVQAAMEGCDAVLHLAAAHHDFGIDEETYFSVNEGGTRVLCEAMDQVGVRHLCFFSSVAVYGTGVLADESVEPDPVHPYGRSKRCAELIVSRWSAQGHGRSALIIRPTVTFGPGNFANMYRLIEQVDRGVFYPVGSGNNRKSMAFVTNLVEATLHLWKDLKPGLRTFNYVDEPDLTSREIVEAVYRNLGRRPPRVHVPVWLALSLARVLDVVGDAVGRRFPINGQAIEKLAVVESTFAARRIREAGFQASVTLGDGIRQMIEWYRTVPTGKAEARLPPQSIWRQA